MYPVLASAQDFVPHLLIISLSIGIIGGLVKAGTVLQRQMERMVLEQEHAKAEAVWVRTQMEAGGACEPGSADDTVRGLLNVTVERTEKLASFAVDNNHRLERMETNQREQGQRLGKVIAGHEAAVVEHGRFAEIDKRHDEAIDKLTAAVGMLSVDVESLRAMFEAHMEGHA